MIHQEESPLKNKKITIKSEANEIGGQEILIEDWWDRVFGSSWMTAQVNPAAIFYAARSGSASFHVPTDNEVLYGKIGAFGYLVHISELDTNEG